MIEISIFMDLKNCNLMIQRAFMLSMSFFMTP